MMMTQSTNKSGHIIGLLLIVVCIIVFTPIIKSASLLLLPGTFLMVFVLIYSNTKQYHRQSQLVLSVYLYFFICVFYKLLGVSSASLGVIIHHLFFFFLILVMFLLPTLTQRQKAWILYGILIIVSLDILDNIRLCLIHPELYYLVNRDKDPLGVNLNIGSSKFYNAVFFFFTICFLGYLNCKNKIQKYLILGCVVISSVFIFLFCVKAAVILFTCLSGVLLYLAKRAKNPRKFVYFILIPFLLVYYVLNSYSDFIIELISNSFSSDRLIQRLVLLIDSDSSETTTLEARENLWLISVDTWFDNFSNFLVGIGDHRANWDAGQNAADIGIGQHSDFLDSLARYGLIGLFLLVQILYCSFKYILSIYDKEYRLQLLVVFLLFILFGLTKGVFQADIGFILYVFLPLMAPFLNR